MQRLLVRGNVKEFREVADQTEMLLAILSIRRGKIKAGAASRFWMAAALGLGIALYLLQAWHLKEAAAPSTDEGVYAEAGRLIMEGRIPHADFLLVHMPFLSIFIGFLLAIFDDYHLVRVAYLALNCASVPLLYISLARIFKSPPSALIATLIYAGFETMVHHDARFLAVRQLVNVFYIGFIFSLTSFTASSHAQTIARATLYVLAAFTFLPSVAFFSMTHYALFQSDESNRDEMSWKSLLPARELVVLLVSTLLLLGLYFGLIPHAFDQVIRLQADRPYVQLMDRWRWIVNGEGKDLVFYAVGLLGIPFAGLMLADRYRLPAALFGCVVVSALLPRSFYPHYLVTAGPALAFGVSALLTYLARFEGAAARMAFGIAIATLLGLHFYKTGPSLWSEWMGNRHQGYGQVIASLKRMPKPILTLEPIYAVEAGIPIVSHFFQADMRYLRVRGQRLDESQLKDLESRACTVLLEPFSAGFYLSDEEKIRWQKEFVSVSSNWWGEIFVSRASHCWTGGRELSSQLQALDRSPPGAQ